jgi:type 1 glutamine amidotransferase
LKKLVWLIVLYQASFILGERPSVPGRDPQKLQALILTGYNMHDWRNISLALAEMLEKSGKFQVRINEEPGGSTDVTFSGYDVLVLNYTNYQGRFGPTWPEATRQAFLNFLRSGKGVVAYHAACGSFQEWPEYGRVLGGVAGGASGHAPYHTFEVKIQDSNHPITKGLSRAFQTTDELYFGLTIEPNIHLLATAYDDPGNCFDERTPKVCGSGKSEPVIWTTEYGEGRIFHTVLGHDLKSISVQGFVATFLRGTEWAATAKVTIPAP